MYKLPLEKSQYTRRTKTGKVVTVNDKRTKKDKLTYNQFLKMVKELGDFADEADNIGRDYARSNIPAAINVLMFDNKIDKKFKPVLLKIARDSASELEESMKEID